MANTANIMSIAPNPTASSTRPTAPKTQPKHKPAARQPKNFGATLDKVNAKIDDVKQSVQDLQDTIKKLSQAEAETDAQTDQPDATQESQAQGMSNTPQDAPQLGQLMSSAGETQPPLEDVLKVTIPLPDEDKPAEIFFGTNERPQVTVQPPTPVEQPIQPAEKILPEVSVPVDNEQLAPIDEQPATNPLVMSAMPFLFNVNAETLLNVKPVDVTTQSSAPAASVEAVQEIPASNLMTVMPQTPAAEANARSMLQMLGGKSWRPLTQAQPVDIQPQVQPQAQPVNIQPQIQPQAQPVDIQPQVQPTVQPVEVQPQVQPQAQPVGVQPQVQPTVQPVEVQPQVQPQAQPVEVQPQVQPTAQPVEVQPQVQPQAQLVEVQPQIQPTAQPVDIQPQVQPTAQPVEVQPKVQPQAQPVDIQPQIQPQAQPVDIQPQVQSTAQPVEVQPQVQPQAQPVDIQPQVQPQAQPVDIQPQVQPTAQPVDIQPQVQPQAQPVDIQPQAQPQVQPVEVQPQVQPTVQPVDIQPQVQSTAQPVDIQPQVQSQAQPIVQQQAQAQQQPAQNLSELLGVNVQTEDAPTAAPVTAPQAPPQQFDQNPQQGTQQNFQPQTFQPTPDADATPRQVSAGGEIFSIPLTPTAEAQPQVQQSTPVQTPDAPPPMPADEFDVPGQIVRQARLIRTAENTEMVIKLNPEHLGELTLRISVSANGAVNASFHSDNAQVRTIIENSLVQLRQELSNAGLKVDNVDVYAGLNEGGLMNGRGGQAWQQNRQQRQGNRQIDFDTLERDVDATAPVNQSTADGVDYSV